MTGKSGTGEGETLVFTCAGAAHVGQVANRVGILLRQKKLGALFCTAAVAAEIPEKFERARNAGRRVALDGCEDDCCRKVIERAGLPCDLHVRITDLGIEKQPARPSLVTDARKALDHVRSRL